jgi:hypothetical protein
MRFTGVHQASLAITYGLKENLVKCRRYRSSVGLRNSIADLHRQVGEILSALDAYLASVGPLVDHKVGSNFPMGSIANQEDPFEEE